MSAEPSEVATREGYDLWAAVYDSDHNPLIALEERHFSSMLGEVRGRAIADIGCGTGRHAIPLAAAGAKVVGIDFSSGMMKVARAKPGANRVRFVAADLAQPMPLKSESFDCVICCLVLDHIDGLEHLFAEMKRICKSAGFILISAMHPAITLAGGHAGFIDPKTGEKVRPQSVANQISDFVNAAGAAGLKIERMAEYMIDDHIGSVREPKPGMLDMSKLIGWPLLLLMRIAR